MSSYKRTFFASFLLMAITCASVPGAQSLKQMPNMSTDKLVSLEDFLGELGETFNCHFTVEEAFIPNRVLNPMSSYLVNSSSPKLTLQQQLEALQKDVPYFSFHMDKKDPCMVHIIDTRLEKLEGYGLDMEIKEIDFTGTVNELISKIGKQGIPVSPVQLISTEDALFWDLTTKVHVKGMSLKVRNALSDFLPLKEYSRVLWTSRTNIEKRDLSYIFFRGLRTKTKG